MSVLESKMKPIEGNISSGVKKENYEDPDW
jgi:hypothetical protein